MTTRDKHAEALDSSVHTLAGQAVLNAIPTAAAILNGAGLLIACNRALQKSTRSPTLSTIIWGHSGDDYLSYIARIKLYKFEEGFGRLSAG